jgi:AcrR family transcriptional regulator
VHPATAVAGIGGRGDRREAQRLATREKLLEVSVAEFKRHGFAQTEIATIAEHAGVSRGTFYFHFPTKDNVLAELQMREERRIVRDVSPLLVSGEPLDSVLRAVVAGVLNAEGRLGADVVREMCAVQFRSSVIVSDAVSHHPVAELVLAAVLRSERPARSEDVDQASADLAVIFLVGMFGLLSTSTGPSKDRDRLIEALVSLTIKGVSNK